MLDASWDAGVKVGGKNVDSWGDAAWNASNDAANAVWNGPACSYYGWW